MTVDEVRQLASDLVYWHSQGLCALDGPCADCDCWDPQHQLERAQAAWLLSRGWHLAAGGPALRVAADAGDGK